MTTEIEYLRRLTRGNTWVGTIGVSGSPIHISYQDKRLKVYINDRPVRIPGLYRRMDNEKLKAILLPFGMWVKRFK